MTTRRRWSRHLPVLAMLMVAAVAPACTASVTSTAGGCAGNMEEFLNRSGDSAFGDVPRPQLRAAWEVWSADLAATGLLDLCKGEPEVGLPLTPPAELANGTVQRVRPVVPSPFDPEGSIAAQVIYVTEADHGVRASAMTLMAVKADAVLAGRHDDQVVYAHGSAGINTGCDQAVDSVFSAAFIPGLRDGDAADVSDLLQQFLDADKVVQAPYYVGIGPQWSGAASPYLSRDTTGRTVIDAVRAVAQLGASSRWGVIGHSQGGHAAIAAAEMAPTYGAGTDLVGAVGMAPPLDVEGTLDYWLDSVDAEGTGVDPRPADGATPPDSPSVMTLGAHLFWGLAADVPGLPSRTAMLNPFYRFDANESIYLNSLGTLNPVGPSLLNSGDPPTWNPSYGIYTSGPSAVPDSGQVALLTPSVGTLQSGFADLDWKYSPWSIPRKDQLVIGCGWATNGAPGGVLYQYAVNYRNNNMSYPSGTWHVGLPMMFSASYQDPGSAAWDGIRTVLRQQSLVDDPIAAPLLVTSGDADSLLPTGPPGTTERHTTRAAVRTMCAAGDDVELLHQAGVGHGGALGAFKGPASAWLIDRLDGTPINAGDLCTGL